MNEPATKGEQTQRAILTEAIARFGQDGYRSTSIADIARGAGVAATAPYAYFANKEALFLEALDDDAAAVINEGVNHLLQAPLSVEWTESLLSSLVTAVARHPLAGRVLSGLEPKVTDRMADLPALTELRKAVAERLRLDQASGLVRSDIDPASIANGAVAIILSLLMSVLQFGPEGLSEHAPDVMAVFSAAIDPPTT